MNDHPQPPSAPGIIITSLLSIMNHNLSTQATQSTTERVRWDSSCRMLSISACISHSLASSYFLHLPARGQIIGEQGGHRMMAKRCTGGWGITWFAAFASHTGTRRHVVCTPLDAGWVAYSTMIRMLFQAIHEQLQHCAKAMNSGINQEIFWHSTKL